LRVIERGEKKSAFIRERQGQEIVRRPRGEIGKGVLENSEGVKKKSASP